MAGVKGKSGGPRANAGGARAGAGRKPNPPPPPPVAIPGDDTLQLLKDIAFGRVEANAGQIRAAIAAVQYEHTKRGDGGKKDEVADKAKAAGRGKFAASAPPPRMSH